MANKHRVFCTLYIGLLLTIPSIHLLRKLHTDTGGVMSRYMPLSCAVLLSVLLILSIQNKRPLQHFAWRSIFWAYCFAVVLLVALGGYLLLTLSTITFPMITLSTALLLAIGLILVKRSHH